MCVNVTDSYFFCSCVLFSFTGTKWIWDSFKRRKTEKTKTASVLSKNWTARIVSLNTKPWVWESGRCLIPVVRSLFSVLTKVELLSSMSEWKHQAHFGGFHLWRCSEEETEEGGTQTQVAVFNLAVSGRPLLGKLQRIGTNQKPKPRWRQRLKFGFWVTPSWFLETLE